MNTINRAILVIIDDVRSDQFFDMIDQGLLPNFKGLMENGIYSKNCVTDFPSITYPTQVSTITGTYTGDYRTELCHGIPNFNWMGRNFIPPLLRNYGSNKLEIYKLNQDLGENCRTIFEMVEEGNKSSITQFINRGADYFFPKNKRQLILFYLIINYWRNIKRLIEYANTIVVYKLLDNFRNPAKYFQMKEAPILSLLWFMSSDVLMHQFGNKSTLYRLNLMHIDKVIGQLVVGLKALGYLDETAIAITSDHGNYTSKKLGTLEGFFRTKGLRNYFPKRNNQGNVNLAEFGGLGFFNFNGTIGNRSKNQWGYPSIKELASYGPKEINLLDGLFKIKGTRLMYYRNNHNSYDKGEIFLKKKGKNSDTYLTGKIEYRGTGKSMKTRYICDEDDIDVFGYHTDEVASALIDGKFHTIDEWLTGTAYLDYPLYPDLLVRHFKNPRSADIILSTRGEVVYNIVHGKAKKKRLHNHDIGLRESSIIPLIISGSNEIPRRRVEFCKITDILPTLLYLMGQKVDKSVIGNNLIVL
ncbi:MAG: hypothetical protein GF311_19160 [Candidatus Lokiarchaeota archaeon]|nr:hypothetical protein [Candidatus Lokiarchaeota archaeon]